MSTVLSGKRLADAIRHMLKREADLCCAVAFWGPEAAELAAARSLKVVLDISMGGTSRNALEALGVPENPNVKVLDGLHAKLYVGATSAILASANASRNALGSDRQAPLLEEAGILLDRHDDPVAYDAAARLSKRYWKAGWQAGQADLERAVRAPASLAVRDRPQADPAIFSVLSTLLGDPSRFSNTAFIFGDERLPAPEARDATKAYQESTAEEEGLAHRTLICVTTDKDEDRVLDEASYILMYWFGSGSGLLAYHDIVRIRMKARRVAYFGRRQWSTVRQRLALLGGVTRSGYWAADREWAESIADSQGGERSERFVILRHDELHELLERSAG